MFNVTINDDDILEDDETFNLTINPTSLPSEVSINNPAQVTVTIVDDEGNWYCNNVNAFWMYAYVLYVCVYTVHV